MIGTFGGSEIRHAESCVRLHNPNEAHRRERPTPQQQLCSDDDIPLSLLDPPPEGLGLRWLPHGISIEPNHCRVRKQSLRILFHPLCALPDQLHARAGTGDTGLGDGRNVSAVGTEQTTCLSRVHQRHTTGRTAGNLAAVTTDEGAGIALPVEKQQDTGPATDRLPDGLERAAGSVPCRDHDRVNQRPVRSVAHQTAMGLRTTIPRCSTAALVSREGWEELRTSTACSSCALNQATSRAW